MWARWAAGQSISQLEARLIDAMKATATGDMNLSQVRSVEAQAAQAESYHEQVESLKEKLAALKVCPLQPLFTCAPAFHLRETPTP